MKAIILAAGKGSRISDKIEGIPKSILKLNDGTPIIRRTVENMIKNNITPIVCVGYKKELIYEALDGLNVKYYVNPFYAFTNNIVSLWFAIEELDAEDVLLTSADLYYPEKFLNMMKEATGNISMAVDSSRIETGDFYFSVGEDNKIIKYGPNTPLEERTYEYMGLSKVSSEFIKKLKSKINEYIDCEVFDKYFEDLLINYNINGNETITFVDVAGDFWREFDFYEDYQAILNYEKEISKL